MLHTYTLYVWRSKLKSNMSQMSDNTGTITMEEQVHLTLDFSKSKLLHTYTLYVWRSKFKSLGGQGTTPGATSPIHMFRRANKRDLL